VGSLIWEGSGNNKNSSYLNDQVRQHHLLLGDLCHPLLDRVLGHEAVDHHLVLLADTVGSRESLDVVVRVPIRVVDDDGVGRVQVDAETSGTRGQQEAELFGAFLVEAIDGILGSML
jgi:hypothetical protein